MVFDAAFFDRSIDRRNTQCIKWDAVASDGRLPLWVADMDFASPPAIERALAERIEHPIFGYTQMDDALDKDALRAWWQTRHGLVVAREDLLSVPGVVTGLRLAVQTMTAPGDTLIVQPPVYGPFFDSIKRSGRRVMENRLTLTRDGWRMDLENLEACLQKGARVLLLCNPHNPVGRVWRAEELAALEALCAQYDAWVISDEIHADFCYADHPMTPFLAVPGAASHALACVAASKTFNIAGLQQANMIVPDASLREKIAARIAETGIESGNLLSLAATRAAYREGAPWLDGLLAYLEASRDLLLAFLHTELPEVTCPGIEGTFLAFLDFRACGLPIEEVRRRLNMPGGVMLSDGDVFGEAGAGWMRLNFGCTHALLRQALERIKQCLYQKA
ncbi:MAG: MalY/PatB family protein [Clostridia bacterium]